ncbi:MAG: DNA repair and recombination protein RadB [Candidatus Woesearchaeota archaeon]
MQEEKIPSGSDAIDHLLSGGYEKDVITVIYGPSGSGKTNICLCAIASIAPKKKVIFMDTEGGFSITRLYQIVGNSEKIMKNVMVLQPTNFEEQLADFERLKDLVDENIGIIIIDTISSLYRIERTEEDIKGINSSLGRMLNYLSQIARKQKIPVLITSQVYSDFENKGRIKIVGGDIVRYSGKCLIELQQLENSRIAVLRKHRSLPEGNQVAFEIKEKGVFLVKRRFSIF